MKKTLTILIFLCVASSGFAVSISVGLLATFAPLEYDNQTVLMTGSTASIDYTFETLGERVYVDFAYLEASVAFAACVTQLNTTVTLPDTSAWTSSNFTMDEIEIRLVGRYPFSLGTFTLFPLAGFSKDFCLSGNYDGVAFTSDNISDFSPWFFLAGAGADFKIAPKLYVRTELTVAYNLTSERSASYYTGIPYQSSSGWEIQLAAGAGYSF